MSKISILIPARDEPHLIKTLDDIFLKAKGDFEVILVLDGYKPDVMPKERDNLKIVCLEESKGMRHALNMAANMAAGEYIMKVDAHCMFSDGFDEQLKQHHEYDWLSIPSRCNLDADAWVKKHDPICYEFVAYPYASWRRPVGGLHSKKWLGPNGDGNDYRHHQYYWKERQRAEFPIDETQTWLGFCWFMSKQRFFDIEGLNENLWNIHVEAQELGFKTWLSGGKLMVNKHVWVAHWWKNDERRIYKLDWNAMRQTQAYSTWFWTSDKWHKQTRPFKWFVEHFWPIPGWPDNWEEEKIKFEKQHPSYRNADYL
jgi:glycosyltransferase involved in cell wall biosynthesis